MESALISASVLIRFCQHAGIDLDKRFQSKEFLARYEIEALADFCQLKLRQESLSQKVISIAHKKEKQRIGGLVKKN
jgi:hypothetical protein